MARRRVNPKSAWICGLVAGLVLASPPARADYPIASHRYLADPGSLVIGDRVYLYNSNDDDNPVEGGYEMAAIVCISSDDLKNWTDHGEVLRVPRDASWAGDSWAPSMLKRDGKIFLYFGDSGRAVGVASSDSPTGPFKDTKGSALINGSTPGASGTNSWLFDPGALIDDDGTAYVAFGGNGENNARIIQLGADLSSVSGSATALSPPGFYEAAFMFKRDGRYYLAYSTDSANGLRIDYLMSDSPMSGYAYAGVVADQPPSNDNNNHASEFELGGKWYHAYHNRYVATQAGIPTGYRRNLALEVLEFDADGKIKPVTYTTDGVPQVRYLDPYVRVEAETTNAQSGIETEPCSDGGMNVTDIDDGDWIRVRGVDFGSASPLSFSARVASTIAGGSIELRLDSETGTVVGSCSVPATGGDQVWMTTTCDVAGATGVKDLYLKFGAGGFNVDSWQFTPAGGGGGSGGAASTGGSAAAGSGGISSSGASTGGTTSAAGGTPVVTPPQSTASSGDSNGCSCGVVRERGSGSIGFGLGLGLGTMLLLRRRRSAVKR